MSRQSSPSSVLLVRPGAIGDTLLLAPALMAMRSTWPAARVCLVGHPAAGDVLSAAGLLDSFVSRDSPQADALFALSPSLAKALWSRPSCAVVWANSAADVLSHNLGALGTRVIAAPSRPAENSGIHVAQHLLDTMAPLGISGDVRSWSGLPASPEPIAVDEVATERVMLHPGSGSGCKNWPAQNYAALAELLSRELQAEVTVLTGPADEAALAEFAAACQVTYQVLSNQPLAQLRQLLWSCSLYVGNDSGISHLAGMSGAPTLTLFGPTSPELWRPIGPRVRVVRRAVLRELTPDEVLSAARQLKDELGTSRAPA